MHNRKINGVIYNSPAESIEDIKKRLREKEVQKAKHLLSQAMSHLQALKVYSELEKKKK
jgi:wobble nucleotide-excising tRNase